MAHGGVLLYNTTNRLSLYNTTNRLSLYNTTNRPERPDIPFHWFRPFHYITLPFHYITLPFHYITLPTGYRGQSRMRRIRTWPVYWAANQDAPNTPNRADLISTALSVLEFDPAIGRRPRYWTGQHILLLYHSCKTSSDWLSPWPHLHKKCTQLTPPSGALILLSSLMFDVRQIPCIFNEAAAIWLAECFLRDTLCRNGGILMKLACDTWYISRLIKFNVRKLPCIFNEDAIWLAECFPHDILRRDCRILMKIVCDTWYINPSLSSMFDKVRAYLMRLLQSDWLNIFCIISSKGMVGFWWNLLILLDT
jgi:hypothetical protein